MPGDENKEGTQETNTVDWKVKYEQLLQEKGRLASDLEGLKARVGKFEGGMRKQVEDRLFKGLVDPDLRTLAPKIEIDPESGDITGTSAEAFNKWKAVKGHFFGESTDDTGTEDREEKRQEPERRAVPPMGGATSKRSVAWFEELEKKSPEEWSRKEVQQAYIRALEEEDNNKR